MTIFSLVEFHIESFDSWCSLPIIFETGFRESNLDLTLVYFLNFVKLRSIKTETLEPKT